ncbi:MULTISPECIES: tetratricopeptide repeat protein [unclassified Pseudomonas]|uniref:tetratricopeptide repeat protein n=1 Tax=unclassified Pseudomonas TaxID=196821 RepID=UPI002AC935CB|nr:MULTISPECIES: tetratricopeptide repeat protein [unclassified Pseudomonas]MEB0040669.1 tetratricopeptide repeat protein [Pseudomonas sp. MH10]MEB0076138.1 tetratricopeptide repeat protein [Pseudomonas sp. MH10out]MEB0090633.1 tetratricopeptide repeat protein [Pseudomonas sp. CCI4.2]MEB0100062.1 tetratricopeptide repeat protein [Pseudomonas sp. CCI3.2]MEB0119667.1 tetratricopeptide repeat protein [Pseudomonas sp. CCI1.2]
MPKPPLNGSPAEPKTRRRWPIGFSIACLAIAVGGGLLWLRSGPSAPPAIVHTISYGRALAQAQDGKPGAARVLYQQFARTDLSGPRRAGLLVELSNFPGPQALKLAGEALHSDEVLVRQAAIDAIVKLVSGSQRSVLLGPLLDEKEPDTRFSAAKALLGLTPDEVGLYFTPLEQVVEEYKTALQAKVPATSQSQLQLARLYLHTNDPARAATALEQALALEPGNLEAALAQIDLLDKQGQAEKARHLLGQLLEHNPSSSMLQHAFGMWLLNHGQSEYALLGLTKAVELDPENNDFRYDLAVALHGLEQLEPAQKQLEDILQRQPANRRSRVLLIHYWQESGQLQKVQVLLAELEQQNPDDPALQQGL